MKYFIGTSGYIYKDWQGLFYPKGLKQKDRLKYYASQFNTVEINASFYRMQSYETYKKWSDETPPGFVFTVKLSRYITHMKKLKMDSECNRWLQDFLLSCKGLGKKFGCLLVQLPPFLLYNLNYLYDFSDELKKLKSELNLKFDTAFEFRNASWFVDQVFEFLLQNKYTWVSADSNVWPDEKRITGSIAYLRFHGPGQLFASGYTNKVLLEHAEFLLDHETKLKRAYIYFNNDVAALSVANAKVIRKFLTGQDLDSEPSLSFR